ncbi:hypothetical protein AB0B78_25645 [Streptomyces sp. NPDC040724]|uniref:hypothetical protein n=1 Tax=unclassified Streptomyces TaxID=2593676 RepID=UPI0033D0C60B
MNRLTIPLGGEAEATWQAMLRGENGIRAIEEEWAASPPHPHSRAGAAGAG